LLDTNVVSELRRPRPHGAVLAWLQGVEDAYLHLAAVTLGEIQAGIDLTREYEVAMIAAIATVHQLTVVTRNTRDFQGFGVVLLNPFEVG
jgi:predicted nucleic acid-binding protein